jgi:hypothetical protein
MELAAAAVATFEPPLGSSVHTAEGLRMRRLRDFPRLTGTDLLKAAPVALVVVAIAGLVVDGFL